MRTELTDEQFEQQYKPIQNIVSNREEYNGWLFETFGDDEIYISHLAMTEPNRIWTIIDNDGLHIINGWHYANRFGYIVTEIPFNDGDDIIILDEVVETETTINPPTLTLFTMIYCTVGLNNGFDIAAIDELIKLAKKFERQYKENKGYDWEKSAIDWESAVNKFYNEHKPPHWEHVEIIDR